MSNEPLQLKVGDAVQLNFAGDQANTRHMVRVLGYQPGVSLLVHTPRPDGQAIPVREGQQLTVRLLAGNAVYGFESKVLRVCISPFAYLHVAYPKEFASAVVRKAQRASANIIASVDNPNHASDSKQPFSVVISDLSVAGAGLLSPVAIGEVGESIMIRTKITVGGIEKYLSIGAVLRGVRELEQPVDTARYRHGVEFQMLDPQEQLVLHGYVYEQIAQGRAI